MGYCSHKLTATKYFSFFEMRYITWGLNCQTDHHYRAGAVSEPCAVQNCFLRWSIDVTGRVIDS